MSEEQKLDNTPLGVPNDLSALHAKVTGDGGGDDGGDGVASEAVRSGSGESVASPETPAADDVPKPDLAAGESTAAPTEPTELPTGDATGADILDGTPPPTQAEPDPTTSIHDEFGNRFAELAAQAADLQERESRLKESAPILEASQTAKMLADEGDNLGAALTLMGQLTGQSPQDIQRAIYDQITKRMIDGDTEIGRLADSFKADRRERIREKQKADDERKAAERRREKQQEAARIRNALQGISKVVQLHETKYPALTAQRQELPENVIYRTLEEQQRRDIKSGVDTFAGMTPEQVVHWGAERAEAYYNRVFPGAAPRQASTTAKTEQASTSDTQAITNADASEVSAPEVGETKVYGSNEEAIDATLAKYRKRLGI